VLGACAGAEAAGAIWVGAAGFCLAADCFLAEAMAAVGGEAGVAAVGGCFAAPAVGWDGRWPFGKAPVPGSGIMMLTAGVLAELGNSALVGRPVGPDDGRATGIAGDGGAFQDGA